MIFIYSVVTEVLAVTFDIPDDLAQFLEERAPKEGKESAQALLVSLVDKYRHRVRGPHRDSLAPDSYVRPGLAPGGEK
jgi:hypothetical protein